MKIHFSDEVTTYESWLDMPLEENEQKSIVALVAWVANELEVPEEVPEHYLTKRFKVDKINQLKRRDYEDAIKFLVDEGPQFRVH